MATMLELALRQVRIMGDDSHPIAKLTVSENFQDRLPDLQGGGVEPESREVEVAERAITQRFMQALGKSVKSPSRDQTEQLLEQLGGKAQLAAAMAGQPLTPALRKTNSFKKELRAIERLTTTKGKERHGEFSGERRARLEALTQQHVPPRDLARAANRALRRTQMALGVYGDWRFSQDMRQALYRTPVEPYRGPAHRVLEAGGAGFVGEVEAYIFRFNEREDTELERVYELEIQSIK